MTQNLMLQTQQLTKTFKDTQAVRGISLHIPKGKVYGLLGPNGAGKSTTLKMFTGMLKPTSGNILFDGHIWSRQDLKAIGALIEHPPVYDNLTAFENLKVRACLCDVDFRQASAVLKLVELEHTGKKRAGSFSMGMKQRLGIAMALINRPKFLILDEPANGLDPIGIQDLRRLIRRLSDNGITVLLSSHILSEVALMADYIGIINNGVLGYEGAITPGQDLEALFMQVVLATQEV